MRVEEEPVPEGSPVQAVPDELREQIERAAQGDTLSFQRLFERYHDRVFRYAYLRVGRVDEANDLVQDVFLSVGGPSPRSGTGTRGPSRRGCSGSRRGGS